MTFTTKCRGCPIQEDAMAKINVVTCVGSYHVVGWDLFFPEESIILSCIHVGYRIAVDVVRSLAIILHHASYPN